MRRRFPSVRGRAVRLVRMPRLRVFESQEICSEFRDFQYEDSYHQHAIWSYARLNRVRVAMPRTLFSFPSYDWRQKTATLFNCHESSLSATHCRMINA
jgi:hypothetical protein